VHPVWAAKSFASSLDHRHPEKEAMSRVAKIPVTLPSGVEVNVTPAAISVKGPLGTLTQALSPDVVLEREGDKIQIKAADESQQSGAMSGTVRALLANMVQGVTKGFEKKLQLVGVGYRAQAAGNTLNLTLGFSHPVAHKMPTGIKVETPTQTDILLKGIDKQLVGQVAAEIRAYRKPEPYKGKGVRYADEIVILKETKKK
jgi:large subunit ribosomal protein L6